MRHRLCEYDDEPTKDPLFREFLIEDEKDVVHTAEEHCFMRERNEEFALLNSTEEAIVAGEWKAALSSADRRARSANLRAMSLCLAAVSDDHCHTFVWEMFAGQARCTSLAVHGGHIACAPRDNLYGTDLRCPAAKCDILRKVEYFQPWLIVVPWPCKLWGSNSRWNFAMGNIPDLQELRDRDERDFLEFVEKLALCQKRGGRVLHGENPWAPDAETTRTVERPLEKCDYMFVRGHQCQYDLRGDQGFHYKPTGFLVPKTSALTWTLNRLCDGADDVDHPHQVITGKKLSEEAGAWPWSLAREVLHGALVDKCTANIETVFKDGKHYKERFPGATSVFSTADKHVICKELQLRATVMTIYACHDEVPAVLPDTVRRIYVVVDKDQEFAELRDV